MQFQRIFIHIQAAVNLYLQGVELALGPPVMLGDKAARIGPIFSDNKTCPRNNLTA